MILKKTFLIFFIIVFILVSGLYSQEPKSFINGNIEFMKKELGLSDDQVKKISNIMIDSFKQIEEKHIALQRTMIDLKEELLKDSPDMAKIKNIIDKKSAVMSEIEFITIKRDLSIKSILTQEQFMKWKVLKKPEPHRFFNEPFFGDKHDMDKKDFHGKSPKKEKMK